MKKKKGLSYDEKREKMLKIFYDTQSVFNYQEIEKLSVKAGIAFPMVKDVLKSLQADNLVQCQKIGIGVFYWAFPSKALHIYETKVAHSTKQIDYYKQELGNMAQKMESAQIGRQQTEEREELIKKLAALKLRETSLNSQVDKYIRFDPERIALLKKQNDELKTAINLQTDNLEQIKKYIKKQQPGIKDKEIEQTYEIPADLDYIE